MTEPTKRRPQAVNPIASPDEEEMPAANKLVLAAGTDHERTILLRNPRGRENRKKTAQLLPLLGNLESFTKGDEMNLAEVAGVVKNLWSDDKFELEIVPFVFGMNPDDPYLEELDLMEVLEGFMGAVGYILGGSNAPALREAVKK